ncbi:unnamed protein product [Discula destructiva]
MQFNLIALAAVFGIASAAPAVRRSCGGTDGSNSTSTIAAGDKFGLMALRSGSEVHFLPFQAYNSSISAGSVDMGATCDTDSSSAYFTLNAAGELDLYSTDAPWQTAFVDASGMGQGIFGYTTGAQPMVENGQRGVFAFDASDNLSFNGQGFLACPKTDGTFSIWVSTGAASPGGNTDCVGISVRGTKAAAAVSCLYTS